MARSKAKLKAPSISGTASTSTTSQKGGVQLTPSHSSACSTSTGGAVIYTPSTTSETARTPTASIASILPTTSTSLNAVFARLDLKNQRKALRSLQNAILAEALGCYSKEVRNLIATSSSDELWAAFCQLNIENRKKALQMARKDALRSAFEDTNDERGDAVPSYSVSVAPSEPSTDTLTSVFEKLNVKDQDKNTTAVLETNFSPDKSLRQGTSGLDAYETGGSDRDDTIFDEKPDLAEWQELCRACGVEEIPGTINKCKEILKTKNVALADLTEAIANNTVAQTFPSLNQLRKHVLTHNKIANKQTTKQNKFLKRMLRELFRGGRRN